MSMFQHPQASARFVRAAFFSFQDDTCFLFPYFVGACRLIIFAHRFALLANVLAVNS